MDRRTVTCVSTHKPTKGVLKIKHTFRDGQSRAPLVSQNVQADATVRVDVGVVDAGGEVDLGRLERVVGREVNREEKDTARVWGVALQNLVSQILVCDIASADAPVCG
jgi:hypothetical protein